ncbi:MAG: 4-alpha-glucanotransferase [Pseudomonadota bacterium]
MTLPADRANGILLHPTSLPGLHGSGDLGPEAHRFLDWLHSAGQRLWQVLPLGPVGLGNSPYMGSSAFAGNPLLVDLAALGQAGWLTAEELQPPVTKNPCRIDFETSGRYRMERLRSAARRFFAQADRAAMQAFQAFAQAESEWLDDYCLFMALDGEHPGQTWDRWPAALATREPKALQAARARLAGECDFWRFTQWQFFQQWHALKARAQTLDIRIVGDVPIFVAHHSADVWAHPELFELDAHGRPTVVAGVPPDYFSATGQRWGNPLFRWERHRVEGYRWWRARMDQALRLADIVRIDHFRGFAAHWEIPAEAPNAIEGRWVPGPGAELFEALRQDRSDLPIIAEDLGIITPDVEALRDQFGLPGMRILQFAFSGQADHAYLPHNYPANTVAYTGTHDNNTLLGWWRDAPERERAFAQHYLGSDGQAIQWPFMRALSQSVANHVIFPMQDVLELDASERMNVPGVPLDNWAWRFEWTQVPYWLAAVLKDLAAAHGRTAFDGLRLPS